MDTTVTVEGAAQLRAALRYAGNAGVTKALTEANRDAARTVIADAQSRVPVRSGRLRSSLRATGGTRRGVARAGSARVPYAAVIHWGRRRRAPFRGTPYLHDAADAASARVAREYETAIRALLVEVEALLP